MFLQRALCRLFKLVVYIIAIWLIVAVLYLATPSPLPNESSIITSLNNGKTVTRVFDLRKFFPHSDYTPSVRQSRQHDRWSFIMQFQFLHDPTTRSQMLMFGGGYDPLDKINAILEGPTSKPTIQIPYHNISLDELDNKTETNISPAIEIEIAVGDMDGLVPPYVANADATLLYWWTTHEANTMSFRIRTVPEQKIVEIWPDSYFWYDNEKKYPTPPSLKPLITMEFNGDAGSPPKFTFPPPPTSSSPSILYPIRLGLLLFLLPLGAIGFLLFVTFSGIFHGLFILLTRIAAFGGLCITVYGVYWWIKHERPRMSVSLTDVRDVLDTTLDNVRMRSEAATREPTQVVDLEAQNATVSVETVIEKEGKDQT
ncbi:hypothetical protein E1B28_008543 [Marasmius oreades]|uniref:Transmembrane protein n=1 Tax=Marasmius oreades TaxID=181124 RepID=A0A9P7RYQ8_9AGAR|nr:uncharacterized protein E1B28_008543 [Marasmius oreades]KAG7092174.1 hypothetical protein E1B28_008543 [Marasmius oreades]